MLKHHIVALCNYRLLSAFG